MNRVSTKPLRVVVFQEDEWLCAHYVDFDLATQARTLPQLYRSLHKLIASHVVIRLRHNLTPFADLPPASKKYREMFERSKIELPTQITRVRVRGISIPPSKVRVVTSAA